MSSAAVVTVLESVRSALGPALTALASESHGEVNEAISWGVGALALGILLGLLAALVVFGGGREHS